MHQQTDELISAQAKSMHSVLSHSAACTVRSLFLVYSLLQIKIHMQKGRFLLFNLTPVTIFTLHLRAVHAENAAALLLQFCLCIENAWISVFTAFYFSLFCKNYLFF